MQHAVASASESAPMSGPHLTRMCKPYVRATHSSGIAYTVFTGVNANNVTRLWYRANRYNVTSGVVKPLLNESDPNPEKVHPHSVGATTPAIHACGQRLVHTQSMCMFGWEAAEVMCLISIKHVELCPLVLYFTPLDANGNDKAPSSRPKVKIDFCLPSAPPPPRVVAGVCAPVWLSPGTQTAQFALDRLLRWIRFMGDGADQGRSQVGRIFLHSLNRKGDIAAAMNTLDPQLRSVLHTTYWNYFEAAGPWVSDVWPDSHERSPTHPWPGMTNPYDAYPLVYTKCLYEERDRVEWMFIMDVDEFWKSVPPAPQRTIQQFLAPLSTFHQQWHFCAMDEECHRGTPPKMYKGKDHTAVARPKSAVRIGGPRARCQWAPGHLAGHVSIPFGRYNQQRLEDDSFVDQPSCPYPNHIIEKHPSGRPTCSCERLTYLQLVPNKTWDSFQRFCKSQPLDYYLSHDPYRLSPAPGHDRQAWCRFDESVPRAERNYDRLRQAAEVEAEAAARASGVEPVYGTMYMPRGHLDELRVR